MAQNNFHPVVLYCEDVRQIYEFLISSGRNDLALKLAAKSKRTETDKKYADAIRLLDDGTIDIDDEPVVARGEDGAHVMVWKWIHKDEIHGKTQELAEPLPGK